MSNVASLPAAVVDSAGTAARERTAVGPLLRAVGVGKHYRTGWDVLHVLRDCSLSVAPGEFVAIMGKSGSGKSTLLHILGALDVPQTGDVFFDGQPIFAPAEQRRVRTGILDVFSAAERRRNMLRRRVFGFVFQFYHLLPELRAIENVLMPLMVESGVWQWLSVRRKARAAAEEMLDRVGLAERMRHRPNQLSGGERQRVALARALVHRPRVLLADEPTGNLDAESGEGIMQILSDLHRDGQTIVMVTHDASLARRADRVLRLENGKLGTGE